MSNVQYVTDANGHRTAVILPIEEYEDLVESRIETPEQERDLDEKFAQILAESDQEPTVSLEQVRASLLRD